MSLLKKENWFIYLILMLASCGTVSFATAYALDLYDKDAWYRKSIYWILATLCLVFPVFIFLMVFFVEILVKVAEKFEVPGFQIYANPYFWVLCVIIPILGWTVMIAMLIYLVVWPAFMIREGKTEKYVD